MLLTLFSVSPALCWLGLMIIFCALEGLTVTLVSLWFAVGAMAALMVSFLFKSLMVQSFVFALVSLVCLCMVRPIAQRMMPAKGKHIPTNADRLLGREGIVTEAIDNVNAVGEVKVAGQAWSARSEQDIPLEKGAKVRVLRIEGVKLFVERVENAQ